MALTLQIRALCSWRSLSVLYAGGTGSTGVTGSTGDSSVFCLCLVILMTHAFMPAQALTIPRFALHRLSLAARWTM